MVIRCAYNMARLIGNYAQMLAYKYDVVNEDERVEFKEMYINLMDSIRNADGSVSLFTADRKLICHDRLHFPKRINVRKLY